MKPTLIALLALGLFVVGCGKKDPVKSTTPNPEPTKPEPTKVSAGVKLWEFETGNSVRSSPAIGSDGTVYVGSNDNKLYALNGKSGVKLWEFETGNVVESSPAIGSDGKVYLGSEDKKLYAINGKSGDKLWEFETGGRVDSSPTIGSDGTVYIGSGDKKLYAIKADSKGLAKSPWPMRGQNARHTGRVPGAIAPNNTNSALTPNSNPSDAGSAEDPLGQAIAANNGDLKKALIQIAKKDPGHFMQDSEGNINFLSIGDHEIHAESLSLLKGPAVQHITLLNIGKNFSPGKIIDLELKYLKQLPSLKKLYLGHNISDVGLTYLAAEFPYLVNLQFYYRKGVGPTNKGLIQLKAFDRLDALKLGYFDFTSPDVLEFLSSMPLKVLGFRESKLTDATIQKVAALKPNLRRLEIRLDKKQPVQGLTDKALQYIQNIKNLEELNIENYQFSKPALDQLQKALPKCKILSNPTK